MPIDIRKRLKELEEKRRKEKDKITILAGKIQAFLQKNKGKAYTLSELKKNLEFDFELEDVWFPIIFIDSEFRNVKHDDIDGKLYFWVE
jgi:hypothetical protein